MTRQMHLKAGGSGLASRTACGRTVVWLCHALPSDRVSSVIELPTPCAEKTDAVGCTTLIASICWSKFSTTHPP